MLRRALLVDSDAARLELLHGEISPAVQVVPCSSFQTARNQLLTQPPEFLISHVQLGAYNGLHLVYIAVGLGLDIRCLLHDDPIDIHLAFEAKMVGAFYEVTSRLLYSLHAYLQAPLPDRDRRDVRGADRRILFRGGRRSSDRGPAPTPGLSRWLH
jgi:DNA-binding NtrC family response regulator